MKYCLKTKNCCLKTQTKHPITLSLFLFFFSKIGFWDSNLPLHCTKIRTLQNQIVTIRALMSKYWIGHVSKASKWEFLNGTTSFYDRKNLILNRPL